MNIILSGGIADMSDLKRLSEIKAGNFIGVIVGKALYEQKITLKEAVSQLQKQ